jgi:serine-type D-Ala-D-Ala carboxypeptidase/endopeptidase
MVLSYALAKRSGRDFETLLRERLLSPLGMNDTFIVMRPSTVQVAEGHLSNGRPTVLWDVRVDLAGAGGVRSTLPDMVRYLSLEHGMPGAAPDPEDPERILIAGGRKRRRSASGDRPARSGRFKVG